MNYPNNSETFKFAQLRKKTMPYLKHITHSTHHELSNSPRLRKDDNTRFLDVRITADINRVHPPKHMNISIQMPITAQIIINNKPSPESTYKPKKAIIRNYSQYDKCSSSVYRKNMQSTPETVIRAYMSLINKNNQLPRKEFRSRGSLILEPADEKRKPHKSISQLRMRLPSMGNNKAEADSNQICRIRKNIIQSFHIMKKANNKSMSVLPLTTNKLMKIEGKQISGEYKSSNMFMHLKRKSTIGPSEYSSSISRNPCIECNNKFPTESKIIASSKVCIDEVYSAMRMGREEIRLLPTLKVRDLVIRCAEEMPLYIGEHEVLP